MSLALARQGVDEHDGALASEPRARAAGLWRSSPRDALLLGLALAQGGGLALLLALQPRSPLGYALGALALAVLLWWNANTISHNHIHNPLFRARSHNRAFSIYLSLLLGVPQGLWRARHLWHHAGEPAAGRRPLNPQGRLEVALVAGMMALLLALAPAFALCCYLPGYLLGLGLCALQGRGEHPRPLHESPGVSCYHPLYNWLWLNDGHHAEHHLHPSEHWTRLPQHRAAARAAQSALPPVLRALPDAPHNHLQAYLLVLLERLALASAPLQRFMLRSHARAFAALLPRLPPGPPLRSVCIVGGGLFPRTLLVLARLLPQARFLVLDDSPHSLQRARAYLQRHQPALLDRVQLEQGRYHPGDPPRGDALVLPLGLRGPRERCYQAAPAIPVFIHDWLPRRRGISASAVVSWLLLKRLNLVLPPGARP